MAETRPALRLEGGLWCDEVLARLPDLLDGTIDPTELARVRAHLAACDVCTRFGGRYGQTVQRVRAALGEAPAVDGGLSERLRDRLRRETWRG
ncbi:zf-HC2 domain-containing protein [Myxococcota bacterium]|nr:zf-HC2 domain-containing protein [Myxococcota bacterium]